MTFIETAGGMAIISRKLGRRRIAWLTRVFVYLISTRRRELRFLDGPGKRCDASCMPQCEGVVRQEYAASLRSLRLSPSLILSPFLSFLFAHPAAIFQSIAKERAFTRVNAANACVSRTVFTLDRGTTVTRAVELASRGIACLDQASRDKQR